MIKEMDRQMIITDIAQADARVASAERIVARQKLIVDELARRGHDTNVASRLLEQFERDLKNNIKDRDRLRAELNQQKPI
jgi:hypothetical protein